MKFRDDIETGTSGNYVKLKDRETVAGILRGEPSERFVLWENKTKTEVPEGTAGAKFNFKINLVVKDGTTYVAKILEGGAQIYKQLAALSAQWDLDETLILISREGSGLDTEYTVMPAPPKQQPTKEALKFIKALELNVLDEKPKVKNHALGADDSGDTVPF